MLHEVYSLNVLTQGLNGAQESACLLALERVPIHAEVWEPLVKVILTGFFFYLYNKYYNISLHFYSTLLFTKLYLHLFVCFALFADNNLTCYHKSLRIIFLLINNKIESQRAYLTSPEWTVKQKSLDFKSIGLLILPICKNI